MNRIAQFEWLKLPLMITKRWGILGLTAADGHYLVKWPAAAILSPPIAAVIGAYVSATQQEMTFTYSIGAMAVLGFIGQLSAVLGFWAALGYATSNLIDYLTTGDTLSLSGVLAHAISYALLGTLLVLVPVFVSNVRAAVINMTFRLRIARSIESATAAILTGGLVYMWVAVTPLLIRPMFTWPTGSPPVEAIAPLQQQGFLLVLILGCAAAGRVYIEHAALVGDAARHSQVLKAGIADLVLRKAGRRRSYVKSLVSAVLLTILLSGVIANWIIGISLTLFLFGLLTLHSRAGVSSSALLKKLYRVPILARLLVGVVASIAISRIVIGLLWGADNSFTPLLIGASLGAACITLLTVQPDRGRSVTVFRDEP